MDSTTTLIFSLINFLILCVMLYRIAGPALSNFFYTRHTTIRKQMLSAVMTLRQARALAAKSQERYDELPADVEARKNAIADSCAKECVQILKEARDKALHMQRAGERRAADERRRHATMLRERLMRAAFTIAEERLREGVCPATQRAHVERGLEELKRVGVSRAHRVPTTEGENA